MDYLYENKFSNVYEADVGMIVTIDDFKSKYNNKLMYLSGGTSNGYCYKDYNNFKNNPDKVCYIAESVFDDDLLVDFVNNNKNRLIEEGGISTANSIKDEIRKELEYNDYFYEYQKKGVVYTIDAKHFDEEMINGFAESVFDIVDWQSTSSYIAETDWEDAIKSYYDKKIKSLGEEYGL